MTSSISVVREVSTIMGTWLCSRRSRAMNCPSVPGSVRSRSTRSGAAASISGTTRSKRSAAAVRNPSRSSARASSPAIAASSSTMYTNGFSNKTATPFRSCIIARARTFRPFGRALRTQRRGRAPIASEPGPSHVLNSISLLSYAVAASLPVAACSASALQCSRPNSVHSGSSSGMEPAPLVKNSFRQL